MLLEQTLDHSELAVHRPVKHLYVEMVISILHEKFVTNDDEIQIIRIVLVEQTVQYKDVETL
jgi:hypothetical protein